MSTPTPPPDFELESRPQQYHHRGKSILTKLGSSITVLEPDRSFIEALETVVSKKTIENHRLELRVHRFEF